MTANIKFFYSSGSNCCERVKWVLDYKQIKYDLIDADSHYGTEDYLKVNPFGRIPSMIIEGSIINETMVMVNYLEEKYGEKPLLSSDLLVRAEIRQVCEVVNSTIHPIQNSKVVRYFKPELDKTGINKIRAQWIGENLTIFSHYLWAKSQFVVGEQFTLADIFVAIIYNKGLSLGLQRDEFPKFETHWNYLMANPGIKKPCPI